MRSSGFSIIRPCYPSTFRYCSATMPLQKPMILTSHNAAETQRLGSILGKILEDSLLIRLDGELGCGKTCFVQGLAAGLEVPADYDITSPTYTLIHEYEGRLPLVHIDLYRINTSWDMESIGLWDLLEANAVVAVEWAERIQESLWPESNLFIGMKILDDTSRSITLNGYGLEMEHLIREVAAVYLNS